MQKILLIARREFLSRVQKKTFLLTTILLPLVFFLFYALMIYFSVRSSEKLHIAVVDEARIFQGKIETKDNEVVFDVVPGEPDASLREKVAQHRYDGYIRIPAGTDALSLDNLQVYTGKSLGLMTQQKIEDRLNEAVENKRLAAMHLSQAQLDSIQHKNKMEFTSLDGKAERKNVAGISYGVGYISGFLIYFILFIYGAMVMRGVMEEKTSRIAEVIISSVKPFQLMAGKITGIGAVGLVQFLIWVMLIFLLQLLIPLIFPDLMQQMAASPVPNAGAQVAASAKSGALAQLMNGLHSINIPLILCCFIFYFLGGYLLYAALFACVGCAVNEDPQDAQSLMFPIMMPIIFAIVIMTKAVNEPNSGLALFGSLFPFTSPIVMMGRLPYGVPAWQLATSFALLVLGFLCTTWFASKIYRTGILLYGKKPTWKEMIRWAFRKG
jgi:ABC-2 type transport system permease protein